jgi:hypothetical protein
LAARYGLQPEPPTLSDKADTNPVKL